MTEVETRAAVDKAMGLVPSEEEGWDEETQPYAEDAASAIAYALRARLNCEPQEAAWAARCVYESADHFAMAVTGIVGGTPESEQAIVGHVVVQAELARQARDLDELAELTRAGDESRLLRMRERSESDAESFFRADT